MDLKFKRNEFGEYVDTTNTYKILKNEYTKEWHLYILVDEIWEWSISDDRKKYLVDRANEFHLNP